MGRFLPALAVRWRSRSERRAAMVVFGGMVVFVVAIYVVVVLGVGLALGRTDSPHLGLSVLATAVVALLWDAVQVRLSRFAARVARGGRPAPYDALSRFSRSVTGTYAVEELPARMAMVLAQGTGAAWAQVWLHVSGQLQLAATWPPDAVQAASATPPDLAGADDRSGGIWEEPVISRGECLGVLRVQEQERQPLTPVEERLFAGLAAQAGLVLRGAQLRAELAAQVDELSARADDLRASRERLVDAQDEERRRLERDIHDGAQQHLVALAVNLRLAETLAAKAPERALSVLRDQESAADQAIVTLSELSRGIYPRALAEEGLLPALTAAATASPVAVEVRHETTRRYPPAIEAALYFCGLEALQNATKHAQAHRVEVTLREHGDLIELVVEDDGRGFDASGVTEGTGLTSMRDRLDAVGGTLSLVPRRGGGVAVRGLVPTQRGSG